MRTGSTLTGRWIAIRIVPPCAPDAAGDAAALPAAVAAGDAAPPPAVAAGEAGVLLHAARTRPMDVAERPRIEARWMNSRRLSRPAVNASIVSSCSGTALRRTGSNLE